MTRRDRSQPIQLTPEEEEAVLLSYAERLASNPAFQEESRGIKRQIDAGELPDHPQVADGTVGGRTQR